MKAKSHQTIIILTLLLPMCALFAEDWPQWRGQDRTAVVDTASLPAKWPDALKLLWRTEVGEGHSSPVVAADRVFVFSREDDKEIARALRLTDGKVIWSDAYPAPYTMNSAARSHGKGPKSTPVVHNNKLITLGITGIIACFDTQKGTRLWKKDFAAKFKDNAPLYGTAMSPMISEGVCFVHVGGHNDGALIAININTGETKWHWTGDGPGYSSPILATFAGTQQMVTFSQENIIGIEPNSGDLLWQIPFSTPWTQNSVTPLICDGDLILSGLSQGTMRLQVFKEAGSWKTKKVWENSKIGTYMNSPVLFDDIIAAFSDKRSGMHVTFGTKSGDTLWQSQGREGNNAALVRAGDILLSLVTESKLHVFKRSGNGFKTLKTYEVADSPTWAHPAVFDKKIAIKDKTKLTLWSF